MIGNRHFASRHFQAVFPTDTGGGDGVIYAVGLTSLRRVIQFNLAMTATGSTVVERARALLLSFSAFGTVAYSDSMIVSKLFSIAATGVASFTKNLFIGGVSARRAWRAVKASLSRMI